MNKIELIIYRMRWAGTPLIIRLKDSGLKPQAFLKKYNYN
jgi:hypothetical protein